MAGALSRVGDAVRDIAELVEVDDPGWPVVIEALAAVDHVVLYGGSGGSLSSLAEVNGFPASFDPSWVPQAGLVIAHDVLGGVFALNGMHPERLGRPGDPGQVVYFAPDTLEWETFDGGHGHWLMWMLDGGLPEYYATTFWPSWQAEVAELGPQDGITMYPPLWSKEGSENIAATSRQAVPMRELLSFHADTCGQLGLASPGPLGKA